MSEFVTTVGLEVHAELNTKSKMFCGCKNDPHTDTPNLHVCPICMAHPGSLPVVNKEAVKKILEVGIAVDGELADYSEFDRKNYFYPDIPKAYQLSQYLFPFVRGGKLAGVALTRIHLEEDTARSLHDQGEGSRVDFNRAGVPLMELVTEPVIHEASAAAKFAKELQLLFRTLGVSNANMERGEMRVEANISVSKDDKLGTKVEVKNLNSFRSVEQAILYETKRQIVLLTAGGVVIQETRGWDEAKNMTYSQRMKETAEDYRYFPDPDIPKYKLTEIAEFDSSRLSEKMNNTPDKIRLSYKDLGLNSDQIDSLLADVKLRNYFDQVVATEPSLASLAANYVVSDIQGRLAAEPDCNLNTSSAAKFASLMRLTADGEINSRTAKNLLPEVVFDGLEPIKLATERNLLQRNSADELGAVVAQILADNPEVVKDYKSGKESALKFLIGQGMKMTQGAGNPATLKSLFEAELKQ